MVYNTKIETIDPGKRRIVCAAVLYDDGTMLVGPRHFDAVMIAQSERLLPDAKEVEQGFIDQSGTFFDREDSRRIAENAGQIINRCGGDETRLFSENLY